MERVRLVGCVIPDLEDQVLLLHRRDHNQWEVPGGRIEDGEVAIQAVAREAHMRLGIAITALHQIGSTDFQQGVVDYSCELFQVTNYEGQPWIVEPHLYSEMGRHNLLRRNVGRLGLSPNVENLAHSLQRGEIILWHNPVQ